MKNNYEVVFCVVNNGFSETVMASARAAGARGGTVLTATGTANPKAEKFFGVTSFPNKEIVMILVDSTIKEEVLHNLYRDVGLKTAGQGIAFTLPVNDVVGLTPVESTETNVDDSQQTYAEETTSTEKASAGEPSDGQSDNPKDDSEQSDALSASSSDQPPQ